MTRDWAVKDEERSYPIHSKCDRVPSGWIPIMLTVTTNSLLWSVVPRITVSPCGLYVLRCSLCSRGFLPRLLPTTGPLCFLFTAAMLSSGACVTLSSAAFIHPSHLRPLTPEAHAFTRHMSSFLTALLLWKPFPIPYWSMVSLCVTPLRWNLHQCMLLKLEECQSHQQKLLKRMGFLRKMD